MWPLRLDWGWECFKAGASVCRSRNLTWWWWSSREGVLILDSTLTIPHERTLWETSRIGFHSLPKAIRLQAPSCFCIAQVFVSPHWQRYRDCFFRVALKIENKFYFPKVMYEQNSLELVQRYHWHLTSYWYPCTTKTDSMFCCWLAVCCVGQWKNIGNEAGEWDRRGGCANFHSHRTSVLDNCQWLFSLNSFNFIAFLV